MANDFFRRLFGGIGAILRPESLDELPETPIDRDRVPFLSWLFKSESLPRGAESAGSRGSFFAWLFAREPLPLDPPADTRLDRTSFLATVFSRERLPADPAAGPVPGKRDYRA